MIDFEYLRQQIVGSNVGFTTPFGERLMVYCDYTASGRCLRFVESYLQDLQQIYANAHTEDDVTGRSMTELLHQAEKAIKKSVNAGDSGRLISVGTGATGAIDKLQQIVGIAISPATRRNLYNIADSAGSEVDGAALRRSIHEMQPVVFIGPYEHHSNEISWRQSLATTVTVNLDESGQIDLAHLEELLQDAKYAGRLRIGSFSAASNVTGLKTDVHAIASLLHAHGAIACFDYAASAPYVDIDMNPEPAHEADDPSLDAIFISPHKFLGGPGSSGILVFNERIYNRDLPPSVGAGGTVDYVGPQTQDYFDDIEEREKAGTPGVLQTLKAAIVFQIKDEIGIEAIGAREHELTSRAMRAWAENQAIEILGHPDPAKRVGIISFNIRDRRGRYLHHKFVTALLNDLFGIQSRAGCSCAGPYGHRLLGIGDDLSEQYRAAIGEGYCGLKPGWCRIGMHWVMDDAEANYVIAAVDFIANHGHAFLQLYEFDSATGLWSHRKGNPVMAEFSLEAAVNGTSVDSIQIPSGQREREFERYLDHARELASELQADPANTSNVVADHLKDLQFFPLPS